MTGGSRGIGKAMALALAAAGCNGAVGYLTRESERRETADAVRALGRRAVLAPDDVAKSADAPRIAAAAENGLGPVDVLMNNAGRVLFEGIEQMMEAIWNETLGVNLSSMFLMTQAVLPSMRARKWGRIGNLPSVYITGQTIAVNGGVYLSS